jgi:predicted ABC-type exoprotein transport system permease subunit
MLLVSPVQQYVDLLIILAGLAFAAITLRLSSTKTTRTKYIVQRWGVVDAIIMASSALVLITALSGAFSQ